MAMTTAYISRETGAIYFNKEEALADHNEYFPHMKFEDEFYSEEAEEPKPQIYSTMVDWATKTSVVIEESYGRKTTFEKEREKILKIWENQPIEKIEEANNEWVNFLYDNAVSGGWL